MTRPKARPTLPSATGWTRRSRGEGGRVSGFSSGGVRGAEGGKGRAGGVRGFYRRARGGRRAIVRRREAADEARPTRWALGSGEGTHHGDASLASGARARTAAMTGACVGAGRCAPERRGPRREAARRVTFPDAVVGKDIAERRDSSDIFERVAGGGSVKKIHEQERQSKETANSADGPGMLGVPKQLSRAFSISRFPNLARFPVSSPVSSPPRLVPR